MIGHMERLQNSVYAQAKKPTLRPNESEKAFILKQVKSLGLPSVNAIMLARSCNENRAKLLLARIKDGRKEKGHTKYDSKAAVLPGVIYLVEHEKFDGWIKCGMTISMKTRLKMYNGNDPLKRFVLAAVKGVGDRRRAETWLINDLKMQAESCSGEWFRISKQKALEIFEKVY